MDSLLQNIDFNTLKKAYTSDLGSIKQVGTGMYLQNCTLSPALTQFIICPILLSAAQKMGRGERAIWEKDMREKAQKSSQAVLG